MMRPLTAQSTLHELGSQLSQLKSGLTHWLLIYQFPEPLDPGTVLRREGLAATAQYRRPTKIRRAAYGAELDPTIESLSNPKERSLISWIRGVVTE